MSGNQSLKAGEALQVAIDLGAMLNSVDFYGSARGVAPIQDSIVGMPQTAQPRQVFGQVLKAVMNDRVGMLAQPCEATHDRAPEFGREPLQVRLRGWQDCRMCGA